MTVLLMRSQRLPANGNASIKTGPICLSSCLGTSRRAMQSRFHGLCRNTEEICGTVAIERGADKEALSRKLGAHHFIDSATEDVAAALNRIGGARAVLATVTSAKAMTPPIDGLAVRGRLVVVGVDAEPIQVSPLLLIGASRSVVVTPPARQSTRKIRSLSVRCRAYVRSSRQCCSRARRRPMHG
jgi:zinc-binding dehydrogenase